MDPWRIESWQIHRLVIPAGRTIGDNNCAYRRFGVTVLELHTDQGAVGLGYGVSIWLGTFHKAAYYIEPMAPHAALRRRFERALWPRLEKQHPGAALHRLGTPLVKEIYLEKAVRQALWDLSAQSMGLPLYRLLGGRRRSVRAYGSLLDYPLSDAEAVARARRFLDRGIRAIKVKIGADDISRDLARLTLIRDTVGPDVELTADANIAWDAETTLARLEAIAAAGIPLAYLEDPIPHEQVDQYQLLAGQAPIDVVAHDYAGELEQVQALLATGALARLRSGDDVDYNIALARLAEAAGVPVIYGNSIFEYNVHSACGLAGTDRLEFSDLAWNDLLETPVRVEQGYAWAPDVPGHGLVIRPEALQEFRCDEGPER